MTVGPRASTDSKKRMQMTNVCAPPQTAVFFEKKKTVIALFKIYRFLTLNFFFFGQVYTFGCNDEGALGRGGDEMVPDRIELDTKIVQISAGDSHTAMITREGALLVCGNFKVGEAICELGRSRNEGGQVKRRVRRERGRGGGGGGNEKLRI